MRDALRCGELTARALGIAEDLVAVSSTGVIGHPLPMEKFEQHVPQLPSELDSGGADKVAEAIRTTDAFPKSAARCGQAGGQSYQVVGLAKGAGMIHPDMATMLAFILTDADVAPPVLQEAFEQGVARSFNAITVDGDTSTNDMVLVLANGLAKNPQIVAGTPEATAFAALVEETMHDLAKMIVRDGEGATKLVEIRVRGALDDDHARIAARSVATSHLVKTAFFGQDANWGRIIAAVGYSGADVDPDRIDIFFGQIPVVRGGLGTGKELESRATEEVLKLPEFTVTVDLHLGAGESVYYTSDLTYDYVKINADYRT